MNNVAEIASSTYSLITKNVDLMTVAEVTLVALAIIVLIDTLPLGGGSTLLEMVGFMFCIGAFEVGVDDMMQ